MSAPAPPIVLRWTPTRADFDDAMGVFRRSHGGTTLLFPHIGALAAPASGRRWTCRSPTSCSATM